MADSLNAPLPLLQPEKISPRIAAMLSAMKAQRDATADEVVNLCGDLAEAREKIAKLESELEALRAGSPAD